jgi:hypothetical protein|tara:strand:+ start:699 stop:836 length:138 start_codon:yes stop_codon:yes gene_type:complete
VSAEKGGASTSGRKSKISFFDNELRRVFVIFLADFEALFMAFVNA